MMQMEERLRQIEEGRRRREEDKEPNIHWVTPKTCWYRREGERKLRKATIVGAYMNDWYIQYIHKAYHIINEDGSKDTIPAVWVVKSK